jgi:hypothetical protein
MLSCSCEWISIIHTYLVDANPVVSSYSALKLSREAEEREAAERRAIADEERLFKLYARLRVTYPSTAPSALRRLLIDIPCRLFPP